MLSRNLLLERYKSVFRQQTLSFNHAVITNSKSEDKGILIVGLNPSGNPFGKTPDERESIEYSVDCHGEFWDPKHEMMGCFDKKCAYIDLFPIRDGNQNNFKKYNEEYNELMGQLLSVTQDYIESLAPKLIISVNKTSSYYWGYEKNKTSEGFWMGYERQYVKSPLVGREDKGYWKLCKITGIIPSGVNKWRNNTNLLGSYYLQYRQHKAHGQIVKPERQLNSEDIRTIVEWINDPEWAKTLL